MYIAVTGGQEIDNHDVSDAAVGEGINDDDDYYKSNPFT